VFTDCPELLEQRAVMPEDRDSALSLVKGEHPYLTEPKPVFHRAEQSASPRTTEQSHEVDLQEGKRQAAGKTTQEISAAIRKHTSPREAEQRQRAADSLRQWQQTHGESQDKNRGMQR
jgi:hypothetical protein